MEKDFTPTEPVILCQICGASNKPEDLNCRICKAPLIIFSISEKEEKLYDNFDKETYFFDEIRAIKDVLTELKKNISNLKDEILSLKTNIKSIYNSFSSLKEVLRENNVLNVEELDEKLREKEVLTLNIEEQINQLLKKKEDILSKYKGKYFSKFAELLEKALKKFENHNVKDGINFLKKALKRDTKNTELLNLLAFLSLKNKSLKDAKRYIDRSLIVQENTDAKFFLAWYYSIKAKYSKALKIIKKIQDKFPNPFLLWMMKGNLNYSLKDYKNASLCYLNALKFEENPFVRFYLFKCFYNLNDKKNCLVHLKKIIDGEFFREEGLYYLSMLNFILRQKKKAKNYLKELLEKNPTKIKYQFLSLFIKEDVNIENFNNISKTLNIISKKIKEENFFIIKKYFYNLTRKFPAEPFFFLSYLFFKNTEKKFEEDIALIKNFLDGEIPEIYKILANLIYIENLKSFASEKILLKSCRDFYNSCQSQLGKAISLLFLSQKLFEVEKDQESSLKLSKEALILLPEELKIYGVENYVNLIYTTEKREDLYNILKELALNLKEESSMLNLGKIALNLGKEMEAKEIFKNMRNFQGKPQGVIFKYWKELFDNIRSFVL